ncbi:MAG: galactose-1-phosphate uridylyltransferase [Candidatus Berkelbacteria bacterium]|nr:galactose-1-phosphate uridylyltransferase [Candidatus Berkelbacteria bacterium]
MPQLRQNIITGEWVVFAPERAKRPTDYISISTERKQKKSDCPFCIDSTKSEYPKQIEGLEKKHTFVLKNKFPAFVEDPDLESAKLYKIEDEFYNMKIALGGHDVVVIKDHDQELPDFTPAVWTDLIETFKQRYNYFDKIENVEYVMPIYNHGPQAAASIEHPHAQVFASSVVPNIVSRELSHTAKYFTEHKSCAFCDMISHEKEQNTRLIFENDDFVALAFYAARFPFEVWVLPKKHQSHFRDLTEQTTAALSEMMIKIFGRLNETLNDPPLNFFIHSAPVNKEKNEELPNYHWHIEIAPRLSIYGGYELGAGMVIDIITPEQAAEYLRIGKR